MGKKLQGFAAGECWVSRERTSNGKPRGTVLVDFEEVPAAEHYGENGVEWCPVTWAGEACAEISYRAWKKLTGIEVKGGECKRVRFPEGGWVVVEDVK
jgi:hypothetical protein